MVTMNPTQAGQSGVVGTRSAPLGSPRTSGAPKWVLLGPWRPSEGPGEVDLIPTTPDWPAWVGFMVTTHFDLVSDPFHSPIFIGLHSVSTSDNMYHLHSRAGELPRSASSHFDGYNDRGRS